MQNAALAIDQLGQQLQNFSHWREMLADAIESYQRWYDAEPKEDDPDGHEELRLYELIDSLRTDKVNIALVGEFSRGKTELINAIFFSDYKRRLLPSTPGRTTMCPTEILYDAKFPPGIRLLPIETRKSGLTLTEHRKTAINWTTVPLSVNSAEDMAAALSEIGRTKYVSQADAQELGLNLNADEIGNPDGTCEIPVWRHAIVNYPHPLLKRGLVVLDTPGLNALGSEPELTFGMLPAAHAIIFVLAADTGVTRTDLEVWQNHVCAVTHNSESRLAALNKIDTLWDDLSDESDFIGYIQRQIEETRRLLNINTAMIFPVSAQKGLIGKIRDDDDLVRRSGLLPLERKLSTDIITYKQKLIRDKVVNEVGGVMESSRQVMHSRLEELKREYREIHQLRGKSKDIIADMAEKLIKHKNAYEEELQTFQITRRILSEQVKSLLMELSVSRLDTLVEDTRKAMKDSWTTQGLRTGMATFFSGTTKNMMRVKKKADKVYELSNEIYERFHNLHNLPKMKPIKFNVDTYLTQFDRLADDAERFRNSPTMVMTEQHFVIKKFFITLVSRARLVFEESNRATRAWAKAVLTPIYTQIQEHRVMINRRLENLEKLRDNHANLGERVNIIERELKEVKERYELIEDILGKLESIPEEEVSITYN